MTSVADKLRATGKAEFNGWTATTRSTVSSIPKQTTNDTAPRDWVAGQPTILKREETPITPSSNEQPQKKETPSGTLSPQAKETQLRKVEELNNNINPNWLEWRDVRNEIFTRNRLAWAKSWTDIAKQFNEWLIWQEELDFIKQSDPELFASTTQAIQTQRDIARANGTSTVVTNTWVGNLSNDTDVNNAIDVLQNINNNAVARMEALSASQLSTEEIYNKYLDTPELNAKAEKYNTVQAEIIELNNIMKQTEDDIREQKWWQASESYIRALASKQNKDIQRQIDMLEDDLFFAQSDYNTALSSAERLFTFEAQEQAQEYARQESIIQTQLWMDLQTFNLAWDTLLQDKASEEKEYWYNRELEDKKALLESSEAQQQASMLWMRENWFDNSHLIQHTDENGNLHIYDTQKNSVVHTIGNNTWSSTWTNTVTTWFSSDWIPEFTAYTSWDWNASAKYPWANDWTEYSSYFWKVWSWVITSYWWEHDWYTWIDIGWSIWDPIPASVWWVVTKVVTWKVNDKNGAYGNYVDVKDANWNIHRYAHLDTANVKVWDNVAQWQSLWWLGNSWNSTWPHLDYTIRGSDWSLMKSNKIAWFLNGLEWVEWESKVEFNENRASSYLSYMEWWWLPTNAVLGEFGWADKFTKEATQWYIETKTKELAEVWYDLKNPQLLIAQDPKNRETLVSDLKTLASHKSKVEWIVEDIRENWFPRQWAYWEGAIMLAKVRALQLEAKEEDWFNLWVLTWPDLDLIEDILPTPWVFNNVWLSDDEIIEIYENYQYQYVDILNDQLSAQGIVLEQKVNADYRTAWEMIMEMNNAEWEFEDYINTDLFIPKLVE